MSRPQATTPRAAIAPRKIEFRDPDRPPSGETCLIVPRPLIDDIMTRCRLLPIECSGLGAVVPVNGHLVVKELYRVAQTCCGAHTSLDPNAMHEPIVRCVESHGIDPRFWWHSHNSMGAFWSGEDRGTMETLFRDWGVALVVAHDGSYKATLTVGKPVPIQVDLTLFVVGQPEPIDLDRIRKELDADIRQEMHYPMGHHVSTVFDLEAELHRRDWEDFMIGRGEMAGRPLGEEADANERIGFGAGDPGLPEAAGSAVGICAECDAPCGDRDGWDRWERCPYAGQDGFVDCPDGGLGSRRR